jgi:hypothetical protein
MTIDKHVLSIRIRETGKQGIMKINSMQRMLGALVAAAIVGTSAIIAPVVFAQDAARHYSDDAIVRDLKAGKLTVREAQMLRERRDRAAAPAAPVHPVHVAKQPPSARPVKAGRAGKSARAPIRHLTAPHPKKPLKPHGKPPHAGSHRIEQYRAAHRKTVHGKPVRPAAAHAQRATAPVRHQAVKYIR